MNEEILNLINAKSLIENKKNQIINAFIKFYGNNEKERIITAFNNMQIITYCKPEEMQLIIKYTEIEKLKELTSDLLNKININNIDKQTLNKILFEDINESDTISTLDSYLDYLNGDVTRKQDTINLLNNFYQEITEENLDELISQKTFKEIDNIIKLYNNTIETYKNFILSTKEYKEYLIKCSKLKEKISKKYLKKFLIEISNKVTKDKYLEIEKEYNIIINSSFDIFDIEEEYIYLNRDLTSTLIEFFNEKCNQVLEKEFDERIEYIENSRILYFKKLGLNLGDDYSNYKNNEIANKLIPSPDFIETFTKIKEKLYLEMQKEYYESLPEYQINRKIINNLDLLDKDDGYDIYAYMSESTMITPNVKIINNKYTIYSLVLIYLGNDGGYLDTYIIHELNHVLEASLTSFDGKNYIMTNGWEIYNDKISEKADEIEVLINKPKRKYELFNEIINELITQDIVKILFNSENYILKNKNTALISGGTNYEHTKFIAIEFYETYKKEIIESRKNGNIRLIYDTIGENNFNALNDLFNLYYKYFPNEISYELLEDLENGIDNERTKIYYEIEKQKDIILTNMKNYQKSKHKTLSK